MADPPLQRLRSLRCAVPDLAQVDTRKPRFRARGHVLHYERRLIRLAATSLCIALLVTLGLCVGFAPGRASDQPPKTLTVTTTVARTSLYRHHSAGYWAWRFRQRTRQLQAAKADVKRRWTPTVDYALLLASRVYGVPYSDLRTVARCESHFDPFARNGQYLGIFQVHWSPFGFSPFDPVASALSAAQTVRADGSWRQWQCKP